MAAAQDNAPVRIALVDDDRASATLLAAQLETTPELTLVWAMASFDEGVAAVADARADVLLLDLKRPDGVGPQEAVERAREAAPGCLVLLYSALPALELGRVAAGAGADGAVSKGGGVAGLVAAIDAVRGRTGAPAAANDPG